MEYAEMASMLIRRWSQMHRIPRHRKMDEFIQGERFILNYLADRREAVLPSELSAATNLTSARVAAVLQALERKKLITRRQDERDRRRVRVELTAQGASQVLEERARVHAMLEEMLAELGRQDAQEFLRIMGRIVEIEERRVSGLGQPPLL